MRREGNWEFQRDMYKVYFLSLISRPPESAAVIFHDVNNFIAKTRGVSIRRDSKTFTAKTVYIQFIFAAVRWQFLIKISERWGETKNASAARFSRSRRNNARGTPSVFISREVKSSALICQLYLMPRENDADDIFATNTPCVCSQSDDVPSRAV